MSWKFYNPTQIHFAENAITTLPEIVAGLGAKKPLVLTTAGMVRRGLSQTIAQLFGARDVPIVDQVSSNPSIKQMQSLTALCASHQADAIIAWGGGSVIDAAKVLSACLAAPDSWSLENALLQGLAWHGQPMVPVIAIPTTAGTGAEVTPFATVWDTDRQKKLSLAHSDLFPRVAVVDPQLLHGSPADVLVSCGLDAISQALESYWNRNATPVTDLLAVESLQHSLPVIRSLSGSAPSASDFCHMAEASLLAGICISQSRTALAHAMSYPMTARFGVPHGLACGITLPAILRFNQVADSGGKLERLASILGYDSVEEFAQSLAQILDATGARNMMRIYVTRPEDVTPFASEMVYPGRSDNNLRAATVEEIQTILMHSIPS